MKTNTNLDRIRAALYARVSSDRQAEEGTIASQVEALRERIGRDGLRLDEELCFLDDGYSGSTLIRPALERLRDQAANGAVDRVYVYAPDRLARHFAYQFLLVEELQRWGVEVVFLNRELGRSPEDDLLLQVQGIIAEYERAQIRERSRRGKRHAAQHGNVNVLSSAPYGYRYVRKSEGNGQARYEVAWEEAEVVRQMFTWVGQERRSLSEVCRRLQRQGTPTRSGRPWERGTVITMLRNSAYQGKALFGKKRCCERRPRLRPLRGQPEIPRRSYSYTRAETEPIAIPVPALVSEELFAATAEQLTENAKRQRAPQARRRYLLRGLLVCSKCGYALAGQGADHITQTGQKRRYDYYRCGGWRLRSDDGQHVCQAHPMHVGDLDEAVWADVCQLLQHPHKIEEEYERRLRGEDSAATSRIVPIEKVIAKVKKTIARLIDAYSEGSLDKEEFEPRLRRARERLSQLELDAQAQAQEASQRAELTLIIGKLQDFAKRVHEGLEQVDPPTRQEIIRTLVKRVEVDDQQVKIVYRIGNLPFAKAPSDGGILEDCRRRAPQVLP